MLELVIPERDSADSWGYLFPTQFSVWIPENAVSLTLEIATSSSAVPAELYIREGSPVSEDEQYIYCTASTTSAAPPRPLVLSNSTDPQLQPGSLYIAVGTTHPEEQVVSVRAVCVVQEYPDGSAESHNILNVPFFVVTIPNVLRVSVPSGWIPIPAAQSSVNTLAAFESPRVPAQPTYGRLEFNQWAVTEVRTVTDLQSRLEEMFMQNRPLAVAARRETYMLGQEGRVSILIDNAETSATAFACCILESTAVMISLEFSPLGYMKLYETILDSAIATLELNPMRAVEEPEGED